MDWFLSPTKYMVELVPAKQNSDDGVTLEVYDNYLELANEINYELKMHEEFTYDFC